jgi:hypothetical protein
LSRKLACSSAQGVRRVVDYVRSGAPESSNDAFLAGLCAELRACEAEIETEALRMEQEVVRTVGATCDHAPVKGIPVARVPGAPPRHREMVAGCGVAR